MTDDLNDGQAQEKQPSAFDLVGGEARVRELVDRFYDLMDLEPEFSGIRALHPASLDGSRDKLFWFLCGWLGGPDHYIERFGHPRLRAPFAVRDRFDGTRPMGALHGVGDGGYGAAASAARAPRHIVLRYGRLDAQSAGLRNAR